MTNESMTLYGFRITPIHYRSQRDVLYRVDYGDYIATALGVEGVVTLVTEFINSQGVNWKGTSVEQFAKVWRRRMEEGMSIRSLWNKLDYELLQALAHHYNDEDEAEYITPIRRRLELIDSSELNFIVGKWYHRTGARCDITTTSSAGVITAITITIPILNLNYQDSGDGCHGRAVEWIRQIIGEQTWNDLRNKW